MLKWRELEIERTPMIKPYRQRNYKSRRNKKYNSKGPVHLANARKFVEARASPLPNIFRQKSLNNLDSTTSWLPAPSFVNGLPKTIYHFKYPLKTRKIIHVNSHDSSDDEDHKAYVKKTQ